MRCRTSFRVIAVLSALGLAACGRSTDVPGGYVQIKGTGAQSVCSILVRHADGNASTVPAADCRFDPRTNIARMNTEACGHVIFRPAVSIPVGHTHMCEPCMQRPPEPGCSLPWGAEAFYSLIAE